MPSPNFVVTAVFASAAVVFTGTGLADDPRGDHLGTIHFAASGTPEAQAHVVHGVLLVHHMMYPEADREFVAALSADPACAIAWWGRAMTLIHPLWPDAPSADDDRRGADYIARGLACPPPTARERAYLETLKVFFATDAPADYVAGLQALDRAWAELAAHEPDDMDALAFSALFHLAPARFLPKDKSYRIQLQAAGAADRVLERIPDHPGAQHYKIHALDFPLLADRALELCDTYGGIAPEVPHALHMPTHIYTRRGLWDKSIEFNLRSAAAARALGENAGALNGHYPHALDYLTYAYLQRGQYREAMAIRERLAALNGPYSAVQPTAMAFAFAAIPARCALERQAWKDAAALPLHQPVAFPWGKAFLNCDSIVYFARGIGAARSGDLEAARAEIGELERIRDQIAAVNRASVLGGASGNATSRRARVGVVRSRASRRGARADAALRRTGGHRGQGGGDSGRSPARRRPPWRHAARDREFQGGAGRVRGRAGRQPQPIEHALWCRTRGRAQRRRGHRQKIF